MDMFLLVEMDLHSCNCVLFYHSFLTKQMRHETITCTKVNTHEIRDIPIKNKICASRLL
jgi:hypothetical protein